MELLLNAHAPSPSAWVRRWATPLPAGASVLDLACGSGRHLRWLAAQGLRLTGVDRDEAAVAPLRDMAEIVVADIESGPWPLQGRRFDAVVVTHYLWRPLMPRIAESLVDGGLLIYETFAAGNGRYGKPSNPDFLLQPGELLRHFAALRVLGFEDGIEADPPRCVQRLAARAEPPDTVADPARHGLPGPGR